MKVDEKVINEKLSKGETLTSEEQTAILQDEGAVDGYTKSDVQDMDLEDFDNDEPKKEEKPAESEVVNEKQKEQTQQQKQEEPKVQPEGKEDFFVKLERELSKPEGKETLEHFTDREKAYFHQMRRDRKRAQKAEGELDVERRNRFKLEQQIKEPAVVKEPDPVDELKKKDPTDYLTVAEVLSLVDKINKPKEEPKKETKQESTIDNRQVHYLKLCEKEARETHPEDFDAVMELTEDIINNNPKHLIEVAKAMQAGENPAIKAYELIKGDTEFAQLYQVAKTKIEARDKAKTPETPNKAQEEKSKQPDQKKVDEMKKAEEALKNNANKTKTTANVESANDKGEELDFEEIAAMSDLEFSRLPKKKRALFLKRMEEI